ncbi:DUF3844 domain-containing protein ASCRUDRAFT_9219 [Ascoidea rubescens DSM 1968]|uniref:Vacuolar sorting protein Vps3844 C-terminal domain-containing protein n=1 Tax=Ascoidea rubescens DSM 1968 TaxID=1344418 RepID=A0A1D2VD66_9ASCO|nr:hypothetical protein ASCRUDRAFT_9219 [Ascoidea rubescens DSM 1968]ODV59539.1 hypothetical protein ASCRUDRAFT_9219 [Ascoidea rubescens DSM 1968]
MAVWGSATHLYLFPIFNGLSSSSSPILSSNDFKLIIAQRSGLLDNYLSNEFENPQLIGEMEGVLGFFDINEIADTKGKKKGHLVIVTNDNLDLKSNKPVNFQIDFDDALVYESINEILTDNGNEANEIDQFSIFYNFDTEDSDNTNFVDKVLSSELSVLNYDNIKIPKKLPVLNFIEKLQSFNIKITLLLINNNLKSEESSISKNTPVKTLKSIGNSKIYKRSLLTSSGCFLSEEDCIMSTNNCNTNGICSSSSNGDCWSCVCSASYNQTKRSTTTWAGSDCSKIDISIQFNLLFWSAFLLIVFLIGALKLIFKMNEQELPGILSAATNSK